MGLTIVSRRAAAAGDECSPPPGAATRLPTRWRRSAAARYGTSGAAEAQRRVSLVARAGRCAENYCDSMEQRSSTTATYSSPAALQAMTECWAGDAEFRGGASSPSEMRELGTISGTACEAGAVRAKDGKSIGSSALPADAAADRGSGRWPAGTQPRHAAKVFAARRRSRPNFCGFHVSGDLLLVKGSAGPLKRSTCGIMIARQPEPGVKVWTWRRLGH